MLKRFIFAVSFFIFVFFNNINLAKSHTPLTKNIDYILVEKHKRQMTVFNKGKVLKVYKIALGSSPVGHKMRQGDGKTPEGIYYIAGKNPNSAFHLSLKISYPSKKDIEQAKGKNIDLGGDIMIHGLKNGYEWIGESHTSVDWTLGCIAVTNSEIEEIYSKVNGKVTVEIKP